MNRCCFKKRAGSEQLTGKSMADRRGADSCVPGFVRLKTKAHQRVSARVPPLVRLAAAINLTLNGRVLRELGGNINGDGLLCQGAKGGGTCHLQAAVWSGGEN
ncbi:hypothetical protein J6590_023919 [Homalodisca vitripennis]|nr:hypothetical protein J6590_023919 [Homalodisca vitripennis]